MEIKAFIFDLGGVVFNCSFDRTFDIWSKVIGKKADEIKKIFTFPENFEKFERNDITPHEFIDSVSQQLNYKFDDVKFEYGWNAIYADIIPNINSLLEALKKQHHLVALTNTNQVHAKVWVNKYSGTLQHFEKVFSSYEIGARKPEAKAFQIVLDYLNLPPKQAVFLDDNVENVYGAKRMGMNTILVTSYNQMLQDLKNFGIQHG